MGARWERGAGEVVNRRLERAMCLLRGRWGGSQLMLLTCPTPFDFHGCVRWGCLSVCVCVYRRKNSPGMGLPGCNPKRKIR